MKPELFKTLDKSDVKIYKKWARDNFKIGTDINKVWHPVVQNECDKINQEYIDKLNLQKNREISWRAKLSKQELKQRLSSFVVKK